MSLSQLLRLVAPVVAVAVAATGCGPVDSVDSTELTAGFILVGQKDDLGYNQAVWEGADALARARPDVRVLRIENVPEDDSALDALESLIEQGADVVFATSFGHAHAAERVARDHPGVVVVHQGATTPAADLDNHGSYFGAHSEAAFAAGIAAASASADGRLGFIAAFPIPATYNNVNAFTLGARSIDPAATVSVALTGSWCDPVTQQRLASAMTDDGVDVIAQHQDCTTTVLEHAAATGIGAVGYHADGSEVAGDSWLVGAVWTWRDTYVDIVDHVRDGTFAGSPYRRGHVGTLRTDDNPFVLTEVGPRVSASTEERIEQTIAAFAAGEEHVFSGPLRDRDGSPRLAVDETLDRAGVDAMDWWVEGVLDGPTVALGDG